MLIDGIHIPLTSPFTRDGASYLRKLEYNVGRYSLTPAAGLVALTGEGAALADDEAREALRVVGSAASAEKVLVAAIAKDSVRGALALAHAAEAAHFDAVLLAAPPQWQSLRAEELLLFFEAVADASPLPVLLSSDGAAPGYELPSEMIARLARHPQVIGMYQGGLSLGRLKEIAEATVGARREVTVTTTFAPVTRRMQAVAGAATLVTAAALSAGAPATIASSGQQLKTRTKQVGFQMMAAGDAGGLVELLEAGAAGAMPRFAACAPQGCYEAYAAFKDGDRALAMEKQQRLGAADAAVRALGIAAVKYGCDLNGYFGGDVRLPRLGLDAEQRGAVERVLAELRN